MMIALRLQRKHKLKPTAKFEYTAEAEYNEDASGGDTLQKKMVEARISGKG